MIIRCPISYTLTSIVTEKKERPIDIIADILAKSKYFYSYFLYFSYYSLRAITTPDLFVSRLQFLHILRPIHQCRFPQLLAQGAMIGVDELR